MPTNKIIDIVSFFGAWQVHQQFDELIGSLLLTLGARVRLITCGIHGKTCHIDRSFMQYEQDEQESICNNCKLSTNNMMGRLKLLNSEELHLETSAANALNPQFQLEFSRFIDLSEQLAYQSIITHLRKTVEDMGAADRKEINACVEKSCLYAQRLLLEWQVNGLPTHIVSFNGRLFPYYIPAYFAKRFKIEMLFHERGSLFPLKLTYGKLPGDPTRAVDEFKSNGYQTMLGTLSDKALYSGLEIATNSYRLPLNYPNLFNKHNHRPRISIEKPYVVFFESSDDESSASQVLDYSLAKCQTRMIEIVARAIGEIEGLCLIYKLHPNAQKTQTHKKRLKIINNLKSIGIDIRVADGEDADPFVLAENAALLIGLHSSLLAYGWSKNIPVVSHSGSSSAIYSSSKVDFTNIESLEIEQLIRKIIFEHKREKDPNEFFQQLLYSIYQSIECQINVIGPEYIDYFRGNSFNCLEFQVAEQNNSLLLTLLSFIENKNVANSQLDIAIDYLNNRL